MPRKAATPPSELSHRWYLAEWATYYGKTQADASRAMGWPKSNASELWNGKQRYNQDLVDQVILWLEIRSFELFMPPAEAVALRRLRETALVIAADHAMAAEDGGRFDREK